MWAQQPETKQPVFELAKEKIYSIVNKLPDLSGRRKVKIILFDSKRRNTFEISVKCVDDAKKWLAPIKPGGKTIIGDRLEEVRKEIIETGSRDVEVHLFSDLIESDVGDLSLDDAIKKLNKSLNQGKLKPIDWTLRAYTWKGLEKKQLEKKLTLRNTIIQPINQEKPRVILEASDHIMMDIEENNDKIIKINEGMTQLSGLIDQTIKELPGYSNKNISLMIKAICPDIPLAKVQLNNRDVLEIKLSDTSAIGNFNIETKVKLCSLDQWVYKKDISFWKQKHLIEFIPQLSPNELNNPKLIDLPNKRQTTFELISTPKFQISNYPTGRNMFFDNLVEGESFNEMIDIQWNRGAIGKRLTWTLPKLNNAIGYMTTPGGESLDSFVLDDSFQKKLFFKMDHVQTIKNQAIGFDLKATSQKCQIPFSLECKKPVITCFLAKNEIVIPPTISENVITDFIQFESATANAANSVYVKLYACEGNGCDALKISIEDPDAPENMATLNGPSTPFTFQAYKKLNLKVVSSHLGQKKLS